MVIQKARGIGEMDSRRPGEEAGRIEENKNVLRETAYRRSEL